MDNLLGAAQLFALVAGVRLAIYLVNKYRQKMGGHQ